MLHELATSSNLLCAALETYYNACLAIQNSYTRGGKPHLITPQLTLRMNTELKLATSLEAKLRQAKAAISWRMNRSHEHVTVNDLPPELIARIFRIVCETEPCMHRDYSGAHPKPKLTYPTVLSLVCARWRDVTFDTPSLWSHLDVSTSLLLNRYRLDSLVKLHLNQSDQLPLDLRVFDPPGYEVDSYYPRPTRELITKVANRVASFDLNIKGIFDFDYNMHRQLLITFFRSRVSGRLKRLTLIHHGDGTTSL